MIDLHFCATPNGQKISIALEEMELPYRVISYDIFEGDQHTTAFGAINPNRKLPAIVDNQPSFGGPPHAVFESGAILQYLGEKSGRFFPEDPRGRSTTIQWLTWQVANLGPMGGQASHFVRYAPEKIDYAISRYTRELDRLMAVLNRRLGETEYVAGDAYTIADMAIYPGRAAAGLLKIDMSEFPHIMRWMTKIAERPAVARGMSESFAMLPKYAQANASLSAAEWSNLFGEKFLAAPRL